MYAQHLINLGLALSIIVLVGCGTEEESDTASYSSLWESSFRGCGLHCHSPDSANGTENGPDMTTKDKFYSNLVGKSLQDFPDWSKDGNCDSVDFITPGDAAKSSLPASLIQSFSDDLSALLNCTSSFNLHAVNNIIINDQNGLISWIDAGAANN